MVGLIDAAECDVGIADTTSGDVVFNPRHPRRLRARAGAGASMNGYSFSNEPGLAERLQRESREEMKLRLLRDIRIDMAVCEAEGWNPVEYVDELIELLKGLKHADNRAEN